MKRWLLVVVLSLGTLLTLPSTIAFAGNVDTYGIGAKAIALGGAYAAYADGPFAAYYNPAGLTQIKKPTLSMGAELLDPSLKLGNYRAEDSYHKITPYGVSIKDTSPNLVIPFIGFAMPFPNNDRFVFGIAAYVPYGLHIKWDDNLAKNPAAYNSYESYYFREVINPTIAYKINDKWSIGFGILIGMSKTGTKNWQYLDNGTVNLLEGTKIESDLTDYANYSFNVGIMYKPSDKLILGLTYRSRTHTNFKGTVKVKDATGKVLQKVNATTTIDHPDQIQFGIRYIPIKKLSLEADIEWTHWSLINKYTSNFNPALEIPIIFGPINTYKSLYSKTFPRYWKNTLQFRFGAQYKLSNVVTLRGGYYYDPSPIPDNTFDAIWPDGNKSTFSLGAGLNFGRLSVDLAAQYTVSMQKRIIGGESEELNSSYQSITTSGIQNGKVKTTASGHIWGYAITLNYKF
ncbi:OmpP1/FadL family transporter [Hippea jasoniae]|uniref:OmpP1/FadL family transporter n=1 Tax=Hippea jasoniae TaxID=944479 RepID=UPI00054E8B6F|nr:outer membrane protein transport protein [Hippea jasoniae]